MRTSSIRLAPLLALLAACSSVPHRKTSEAAPSGAATMEAAASRSSRAIGMSAPQFAARDQDGRTARLRDLSGRWLVLYFYPRDDTPGCVCEATEFTDLLWKFHALDAEVWGVSPDTVADHRRFRKKYALQIRLLSDPDHTVMRRYGAWVDTTIGARRSGRVVRSTFLIDPGGKVAHHWPEVIPQGHADRVAQKLAQLGGVKRPRAAQP
jgi:peroxiredoxin Q/BCP